MSLDLAVLVSGRGSNLQALVDAIGDGQLDARIVGVFCDRANAPAVERARSAGLATQVVAPRGFATRLEHDAALFDAIDARKPDLIVCAGYMRLIGEREVQARRGRLVNIHPSLLPAFKGLHTHAQAVAAGVAEHGASVHYVTPDLDGGPVIAQARVPVQPGDDAETLARRVLAREHPLLVRTLQLIAQGRIALRDERVQLDGRPLATPLQLAANQRFP
ncbi:phosphoribosylglycinamide formyltransferase [Cognatiluteimonas telluris]|jgi:phosphoribosylglycinamide formyltransferase-1|uniref:phosphoribosylglycinamide formyltransferase n=1 Tax=Cognatiluteimonas telluris TaxID=1104775 RepID=UPI00140B7D47|nr:phosphoribosylglycinamide formyltransferase [Lysobacter telluris]